MRDLLLVNILEGFLGEHRKHNEDTGQISFDCPACSEDKGMPEGDEVCLDVGRVMTPIICMAQL